MFDKLKAMGAMASLLKDKDKLRDAAGRIKARAAAARATGEAGGGAVRATVSGQLKVLSVELTPALASGMAVDTRTRELAGSLIAEAVNSALATAQATMKEAIDKETRELGLPDLGGQIGSLLS